MDGKKAAVSSLMGQAWGQSAMHHSGAEAAEHRGVDLGDGAENVGVDGGRLSLLGTASTGLYPVSGGAVAGLKRGWRGALFGKVSSGGSVPVLARKSLPLSSPQGLYPPPCIITTRHRPKS